MRRNPLISTIVFVFLFIFSCTESGTDNIEAEGEIYVALRMEVHVVDSLLPVYSIPFTKTYFHTYKMSASGIISNEEYSDTTTCRNGWAVKELIYKLHKEDKAYLGATIKIPPGENYQYETVAYNEIKRFASENDSIRFVKSFTIYQ